MIPENEMGVIVVFSQQAHEAGFEIVSIRCEYPDATVKKDERIYRAEFEYKSSNFNLHGHDLRECDLIICWINDTPDCVLPVLALSNPNWKYEDVAIPDAYKVEIAYWKDRALRSEKKEEVIKAKLNHAPIGVLRISKTEMLQRILEHLEKNGDTRMTQLAEQLGTSRSTLYRRMDELQQAGVIHKNGEGWKVN